MRGLSSQANHRCSLILVPGKIVGKYGYYSFTPYVWAMSAVSTDFLFVLRGLIPCSLGRVKRY